MYIIHVNKYTGLHVYIIGNTLQQLFVCITSTVRLIVNVTNLALVREISYLYDNSEKKRSTF